jgi:O-antigen/teichoic acid export membrane protein
MSDNYSIRKNIKSGVLWNSILAFGKQGLNLIATILLARLLCPEDYGLIGMLAIFIGVSECIIDAGLGGALIKKEKVNSKDFSTLSTYNLAVSILLYVVIFALAPKVAEFYERPVLSTLLRLYSVTILVDAFAIVPKVRLSRELRFKELSLATLTSGFIGLITAVILALMEYGVYSLIAQYVITSIVNVVILLMYTRYIFKLDFSYSSFKGLFAFGMNTTLSVMIKDFTGNLFTNVIAKISPLPVTGYYNQSYRIQNVLWSIQQRILDGAFFPILCRERDEDVVRISLKLNTFGFFILSSVYFMLIINAKYIVLVLLGVKWLSVVFYLKILLFVGLIQNFTALNRNMLKSLAFTFDILLTEVLSFVFIAILLAVFNLQTYIVLVFIVLYAIFRFLFSMAMTCEKEKLITSKEFYKLLFSSIFIPCTAMICSMLLQLWTENIIFHNAVFIIVFLLMSECIKPIYYVEIKKIIIGEILKMKKK